MMAGDKPLVLASLLHIGTVFGTLKVHSVLPLGSMHDICVHLSVDDMMEPPYSSRRHSAGSATVPFRVSCWRSQALSRVGIGEILGQQGKF